MIYSKAGSSLSEAYAVDAVSLDNAYDVNGGNVFSSGGGTGIDKYENYTIEMLNYTTPCGQDFAYYDGKLVACTADNTLRVLNATTGSSLGSNFSASVGHCNCLVFSDEFYDNNDVFPLFCTTYSGLSYFRMANTYDSVTNIKNYILATPAVDTDTRWYGIGFHDGYLYTLGYTDGKYQQSTSNRILLAKYDLKNPIDNGDNTYTLPIIYKKRREWFECIQGSEVHDGYFWVMSGFTNPAHVYAIDLETAAILLDIPMAEYSTLEAEAISWANNNTLLVGTKNAGANTGIFKITFPDVE